MILVSNMQIFFLGILEEKGIVYQLTNLTSKHDYVCDLDSETLLLTTFSKIVETHSKQGDLVFGPCMSFDRLGTTALPAYVYDNLDGTYTLKVSVSNK